MSETNRLLMSYQRAWRKWQKRAEQAEAARDKALADVENRERRRQEILDWLEDQIGTAWECDCGYHTYNCYGPTCQDCDRDAPALNVVAFKLYASHTDALKETSGEPE